MPDKKIEPQKNQVNTISKMIANEAKRKPHLLASLIMTWLAEDEEFLPQKTRRPQ